VRLRLKPQERGFYPLFTAVGQNIESAVDLLVTLVPAAFDDRPALAKQVKEAEIRGDDLTREILSKLNATFVTPFDREDIYRLVSYLDNVVDAVEEAADRIVLYRLDVLPDGVVTQSEILCRAARSTAEAMSRLATVSDLGSYAEDINALEDEADVAHRTLIGDLLAPEHGVVENVLHALKVKEVVEALEEAADAFQAVAHVVESIAVKES
jgi:hypothetical protein